MIKELKKAECRLSSVMLLIGMVALEPTNKVGAIALFIVFVARMLEYALIDDKKED